MFVTVSIRPGNGDQGAGPHYGEDVLRSLDAQINAKRPPGYKGHQDPEKVSWEYREPVTAWVGSKFVVGPDGVGELVVKGYIPQTAPELRTQLRLAESGADIVNSVSIFGMRDTDGDEVTNFDLWSLDWTPKGRAGMETELVGVSGEQANKEDSVTREEVIASLKVDDIPDHIVTALRAQGRSEAEESVLGEMRVMFDLDSEADSEAVIAAVRGLVGERADANLTVRIDEALGEANITAEMAQVAVRDTLVSTLSSVSTKEEIAGEIAKIVDRPYIKALMSGTGAPVIRGGGTNSGEGRKATHWA